MDANEYLLHFMVHERLAIERARARWPVAGPATDPGRLRAALGHALIRLGHAVAGEPARRARHA